MSHFLTLVVVDPADGPPARQASRLMRPHFAPDLGMRPEAKCDGFVIGGRFDGVIFGKEQHFNLTPAEFQRRYGLDVVREVDNIRPLSELPADLDPYAVVTPDGVWHERGDSSSSAWTSEVDALLERYPRHFLAVAIDCHC